MTLEEFFFNTSVFRVYVGPYSSGELNYCDRLHILITFIYIITPLLTSSHKPVLARAPSSNILQYNLKTYQSILKRLIRDAKKQYYQKQFEKYKNDLKNTWGTIKHILNRTRSTQTISDVFLIDNVMTTDPTTIANKFNTFFGGIGVELSANVNNTHNSHFTDYLFNPSMYNFTFELITEETTMEILNNLKPKPSCGYDGISTKLLKTCKLEICKSLTLIINQSLSTGIFPDSLKVAKVIPL